MKATRADWAASAPWSGITGRPANPAGISDIGQLSGAGFSDKQAPVWNRLLQKFVPSNVQGIAGYTTPTTPTVQQFIPAFQVSWDVPPLAPLQSVYEDFPLIGAIPSTPVAVGVPFDLQFCIIQGAVISNGSVRLTVINLNGVAVDLGVGLYNIQLFQ